ncbi:MAG: S-adenosylmethionine:tRNA ribosyltransferase-isomerase, partial [Fimbriimonadales bacterium]|nr:S-adenosylmethionine:tRNA ribosyltransferase-isomerase [Fimbriimonadales bacterium]
MSFPDYELPEDLIAQEPLADRSSSRLLVVDSSGRLRDSVFRELPALLNPGDLLVYNDTRVTARRLQGSKESGGRVELLVLRRSGPGSWECLCKPARRLRIGARVWLDAGAWVRVVGQGEGGLRTVQLEDRRIAEEALLEAGEVPLPPYIHRRL